jgi:hypothetical protein
MNGDTEEEYMIIWEQAPLVPPVFKLYYDDKGHVITYTCEESDGNYLVIDAQTYAECRHDVRVVDGKIVLQAASTISRLYLSDTGTLCEKEDISVVSSDEATGNYWNLVIREI